MGKLLRSDFYRLFRSKSFYICTTIVSALLCLSIFMEKWALKVATTQLEGMEGLPSTLRFKDGISYGLIAFTGGDIQMFIAIFSAIFITSEFVHGTMKNTISKGYHRALVYASKLITMIAALFIMIFVLFIASVIAGTIVTGEFGTFTAATVGELFSIIGIEMLLYTALTALFVMIAMIVRNNGGVIAINILGVISFGTLIFSLLEYLFDSKIKFTEFSIQYNISQFYMSMDLSSSTYIRALIVGLVYLIVSTGIGIFAFSKSDIK